MSIGQVVQAGLAGFDLALIAGVEIYYDSTVFAQPGITRLEQLKGKRIGISGYGAATHFAAIILAQHLKLDPDKDLILVPGGPDAERIAAMSAGKIDAGVFNSSTLPIAKRMGLVELVRIPDLKVEVQGNGMATTRTYIKSNRDVVKSALKGYIEGINFIFNNKQAAQKVFGKYMRTNDAEVLETSYQAYINTTPRKPYPTLKGLQFLLGPPRADDAAGEDGEAGTVCRHEFSAGTGEGRLFQRDGETLSGEIESRNIDHKGHKGHRVEDLDANISQRHEGHEGLENLNSETSCSSYYYSSKFARPAQIFWHRKYSESGIPPAKTQRRQGYGERTKTLINDFHPQSPNFAPFASLREILRVSVAAQPHWVLRGENVIH